MVYYMSKKSLLETNPYLKDPLKRQEIIKTVVLSSSAIEGVHSAAEEGLKNFIKTSVDLVPASSSSSKPRT